MAWYVYETAAIDFGWEHLKTVRETAAKFLLEGNDAEVNLKDINATELRDFLSQWEEAKELAGQKGWEGDFRESPVVFWLPHDSDFRYGFAWKQDNNGTSYVISPVEMPWLDEDY